MATAAGFVFVLSLVVGWILESTYVTWPKEQNPAHGRTEPYAIKRLTVYITPAERDILIWLTRLEIGSGVLILLGLILAGSSGGKRARR